MTDTLLNMRDFEKMGTIKSSDFNTEFLGGYGGDEFMNGDGYYNNDSGHSLSPSLHSYTDSSSHGYNDGYDDTSANGVDSQNIKNINSNSNSNNNKKAKKRQRKPKPRRDENSLTPEEAVKKAKFLERNRVAAAKCRNKKKEWLGSLEENARKSHEEKTALQREVLILQNEVFSLKTKMLSHASCGCAEIERYLRAEAMRTRDPQTFDQTLQIIGSS